MAENIYLTKITSLYWHKRTNIVVVATGSCSKMLKLLEKGYFWLFVDAINGLIVEEIEKWDVKVIESCKA